MSDTEAEFIAKMAIAANSNPRILKAIDDREFLILNRDVTSIEITPPNRAERHLPEHIGQTVHIATADSLAEYTKKYQEGYTVLFADHSNNTIVACIDYHEPADGDARGTADWCEHRAILRLECSIEWRDWCNVSGKLMPQLEFARFIEENAADIRAPDAGELLDAVRDLQAHRKVNFSKAVRTASDNECFEWTDETNARTRSGNVEIPNKFLLGIPVYFGESDVELHAFLRWKLDQNNLLLGIQLHRAEHVRQAVFGKICEQVARVTDCPLVMGKMA